MDAVSPRQLSWGNDKEERESEQKSLVVNAEVGWIVATQALELVARDHVGCQEQGLGAQTMNEGNASELVGMISLRGEGKSAVQRSAMLLGTAVFHIAGAMFMLT